MNTVEDRRIFAWRGANDVSRLADLIADLCACELFNLNGSLVRLHANRPIPVTLDLMRTLIAKYVVGVRPVDRGAAGWDVEIQPFEFPNLPNADKEPNQKTLVDLMGRLLDLVAKAPREPSALTDQQEREIRQRLQMGE